jgi:Mlc titration factor MtfA (ptsG expression regulator)
VVKGRTPATVTAHDFYRQTGAMGRIPTETLLSAVPAGFDRLTETERQRLLAHADRLADRANWEAVGGLDLTDDMIATVATHAGLLVAGFDPRTQPFRDVTAIVIQNGSFVTTEVVAGPVRGVVSDSPRHLAGQAGPGRGPIVLDWRTAVDEIAHPEHGTNVILHEFAHKLDQLDGVFDGVPPLGSDAARAAWEQTLGTNYRRLRRRGVDPVVRNYAATNPVEYFAVVTELFFTVPARLRTHHLRVYERLADFYRQDPARRYDG